MRPTDSAVRRAEIVRTLNAAVAQLDRLVTCCEARRWTDASQDLIKIAERLVALTNRVNDEVLAEALLGIRVRARRKLRGPTVRPRAVVGIPVPGRRRNAA